MPFIFIPFMIAAALMAVVMFDPFATYYPPEDDPK
jgi:hypothetical protein